MRDDDDQANKKARGESATPSVADAEGSSMSPPAAPQVDTQEVKDVTQGVKEVDLDGGKASVAEALGGAAPSGEAAAAPENVPLPDEKSGELDELASDGVDAPADVSVEKEELVEATKEVDDDEDEKNSVQSSSAGEAAAPENDKKAGETEQAAYATTNELTTESLSKPSAEDTDATATTKN